MTPLKADRIAAAYSKLRISGLTVDPNPSDLELALGELESMMSELASRGIEVGYNFEQQPDPNSDLGVPQEFWNMVTCNLAVRLISDFNKEPPMTLFNQASQSLSLASGVCARNRIRNVQYPSRQPIGSGNRRYERWQRFYAQFNELPPNKPDTLEIMQGETNDFTESFEAYLRTDEAISAFAVTCDNGLVVVSSVLNVADIDYRLSAPADLTPSIWQQVKIRIETTEGRVEIRIRNFQVTPYVRVGNQGAGQ
ncbi:P22 tail accessory factor [Pseudomonas sp. NFPP05]|uniref:packaged DNA stabilization gp4 family protein n=1 Tax=unclassified Pseudomonas TaxID=196821 RepID=UPI000881818D|nr:MULTISPECIES: packaged DNA stabilization gp4 family protein [unclassified Pseudomonas]SDA11187.1 P22 tail accessory factor [Pseudomonas sp. NFPP12]SFM12276.1 P22 tail accessory factor [Pseudomonas sp. NFPP05]